MKSPRKEALQPIQAACEAGNVGRLQAIAAQALHRADPPPDGYARGQSLERQLRDVKAVMRRVKER
jgi:hypothetical protein